ncbi:MAG: excinuclease ABC subunit B [Nitratiruptor sp.]|nr:excinuclease ABC subunit B [Nitratiruptor sp.]NPA83093.1 excinuclease ABC subunit UvrB [Campylobacterota bacterium]
MAKFQMLAPFPPAGDQPQAIRTIVDSIRAGNRYQTLLGVTGSGKTYTMAKIIEELQLPTLIMTHNKSLAAQLYSEFRRFFPHNHVEYFISYYDYYQPEAYLPRQDLYIEKECSINQELERLRLLATASLLEYDDVIVVASVSANYGLGDPWEYRKMVYRFEVGNQIGQRRLLERLVELGYQRNETSFHQGSFRVRGEAVDIFPAYMEEGLRVEFFDEEIERIALFDPVTGRPTQERSSFTLYGTSQFLVGRERLHQAIKGIEEELAQRLQELKAQGKEVEYHRLKERTLFDLEMLQTTGMCKGIENYTRHLTGKAPGEPPYTLLDYFALKGDYLLIVDESHVSLPQFRGMYAGDRSRKEVLVEHGFRLPSALDNRPLTFDEFIEKAPYYLFVSATPGPEELERSATIAQQIVRPTGLLDPWIRLHPAKDQVATLYDEIKGEIAKGNRVLVTTLTKRMAEELTSYYAQLGLRVRYLHSDLDAIERNHLIRELRQGKFDLLIGINLLREGLDLPEVGMVAILDADKEGFLRSEVALIQTMGRAARHVSGRVVLFVDAIEESYSLYEPADLDGLDHLPTSLKRAIATTLTRRARQAEYNRLHNITPRPVQRPLDEELESKETPEASPKASSPAPTPKERQALIQELQAQMEAAAKRLEFEEAARLRDEIARLKGA